MLMSSLGAAVVESSAALEEGLIEMEVKVDGMTCGHCTSRVEDALAVRALSAGVWIIGFPMFSWTHNQQ